LQFFLQSAVHGQHQRGPGCSLPQGHGAAHSAVKAGVHEHPPVLPAEQIVIGGLQPALPDDSIHRKAAPPGSGPLLCRDRPGEAQRMGQQRAVRPGAHATGGSPHCAALHKIGLVKRRQNVTADALHHGQLPRRRGSKKGSKLCFHILAACQALYGFYGLAQVGARRRRDAQVDVIHGGVAGQNDPGTVHDGPARGVLGHGVAGGAGLGGLVGVVVGADELHPGQPREERRKHRAAQHHQHRHADAAAVGVFAVGHGITSVKNKMDLFVRKWDM